MKTRKKIICFCLCFLMCGALFTIPAAAAGDIGQVEAFDELEGDARYVGGQYRGNYNLDIEKTGLLDVGSVMLNNIANVLLGVISNLGSLAVHIFYFAMDFDLVALFSDQINGIQAGLKSSVFDSFFVLAFCGTAWIMMKKLARRDVNGMLIEGGKVVLLTLLAAFVVTNSAAALSGATGITKSIGTTALMEINNQGETSISDYAAAAGGMVWKGLVHDPWVTMQFGNTTPTNEDIEAFLTTRADTEERAQLVASYQEAHKSEDGTIFSKSLGGSRIAFLIVYLVPFIIKAALFIVMALLQIAYQLMAVLFVLLAPVILLLAMLPTFGIELVSSWLKKILETQIMVLVLTFIIGVVLKLDNLLYGLSGQYGWFVVAIMEAVVCIVLLINYKKVLGGISKVNEAARQPAAVRYRLQKYGDATQAASHAMGGVKQSVASGVGSVRTWMNNRPEYRPEDYAPPAPPKQETPKPRREAQTTQPFKQSMDAPTDRPITTDERPGTASKDKNAVNNRAVRENNGIERPTTTPRPPERADVGPTKPEPPEAATTTVARPRTTPPAAGQAATAPIRARATEGVSAPTEQPRTAPEGAGRATMPQTGAGASQDTRTAVERPKTAPEGAGQAATLRTGAGTPQDTGTTAERPRTAPEGAGQAAPPRTGAGAPQDTSTTAERPKTAPEGAGQAAPLRTGAGAPQDTSTAAERPKTAPEGADPAAPLQTGARAPQDTSTTAERPKTAPEARRRPVTTSAPDIDIETKPHVNRPTTTRKSLNNETA